MIKNCKTCQRFYELRIAGGGPWKPYCRQEDVYEPCSGGACIYPHYYIKRADYVKNQEDNESNNPNREV